MAVLGAMITGIVCVASGNCDCLGLLTAIHGAEIITCKHKIIISSFFEIDFEIKTNAKKSRRFDLSEVIFK